MDSHSYHKMGESLAAAIVAIAILLTISLPLALWKLVEIVIWLLEHVSISVG